MCNNLIITAVLCGTLSPQQPPNKITSNVYDGSALFIHCTLEEHSMLVTGLIPIQKGQNVWSLQQTSHHIIDTPHYVKCPNNVPKKKQKPEMKDIIQLSHDHKASYPESFCWVGWDYSWKIHPLTWIGCDWLLIVQSPAHTQIAADLTAHDFYLETLPIKPEQGWAGGVSFCDVTS